MPEKTRGHPGIGDATLAVAPLDRGRQLADFLTRRRAALSPDKVGLPGDRSRRRRTPGLRREELATLAGVSVDWYIRLEQGRAEHPSPAVLDGLSRALQLTGDERRHLYVLARGERPPLDPPRVETPDDSLSRVMHALPAEVPALVLGRCWDVLAWNAGAAELLVPFPRYPVSRRNLVMLTFLDATYRDRYADWELVAAETVANFRSSVGRHLDVGEVHELIAYLTQHSERFARWWQQHEVREKSSGQKSFRDGDRVVTYRYDTVVAPANDDQRLVVYTRIAAPQ